MSRNPAPLLPLEANFNDDDADANYDFLALPLPPSSPTMPRLERYDRRDVTNATRSPPQMSAASGHSAHSTTDLKIRGSQRDGRERSRSGKTGTNAGLKSSKVVKKQKDSIKDHVEKVGRIRNILDSDAGQSNKCAQDLVRVTDRPKEGSPDRPQLEQEEPNVATVKPTTIAQNKRSKTAAGKGATGTKTQKSQNGMSLVKVSKTPKNTPHLKQTLSVEKLQIKRKGFSRKSIDRKLVNKASKLQRNTAPVKTNAKISPPNKSINIKTKKAKRSTVDGVMEAEVSGTEKVSRWLESDKSMSEPGSSLLHSKAMTPSKAPPLLPTLSPHKVTLDGGKEKATPRKRKPGPPAGSTPERPVSPKLSANSPRSSHPSLPASPIRVKSSRHRSPKKHFAIEGYDATANARNKFHSNEKSDAHKLETRQATGSDDSRASGPLERAKRKLESASGCSRTEKVKKSVDTSTSLSELEWETTCSSRQLDATDELNTTNLVDDAVAYAQNRTKKTNKSKNSGKVKRAKSKKSSNNPISSTSEHGSATEGLDSPTRSGKRKQLVISSRNDLELKHAESATQNRSSDANKPSHLQTPSKRHADRCIDENEPPAKKHKPAKAELDSGRARNLDEDDSDEEVSFRLQKPATLNEKNLSSEGNSDRRSKTAGKAKTAAAASKGKGQSRGKKPLPAGQQTLDVMLTRKTSHTGPAAASDTISTTSVGSEVLQLSDFNTEEEYHMYLSERLARKLQWEETMMQRYHVNVARFKGSEDGYSFRRKLPREQS